MRSKIFPVACIMMVVVLVLGGCGTTPPTTPPTTPTTTPPTTTPPTTTPPTTTPPTTTPPTTTPPTTTPPTTPPTTTPPTTTPPTTTPPTTTPPTTTPPTTTPPTTTPPTTTPPDVELVFPEVLRISAEELKQLMDEGTKVSIVDTRPDMSYNKGHIWGATNIPGFPSGPSQDIKLKLLPKDRLIVLYCD